MKMTPTIMITIRNLRKIDPPSSKKGDVPDNNFSLNTPSIIYFWKPQAKSSSMKMTLIIIITTRNLMRMNDILQLQGGS